ncbi:hypothetical protein IL54_4697 [Sphingobium sp. ba1]|jgi:hypothetical protein|nr:hypothetical protein IL54_4697 [Sphingobium sp. ba1]
MPTCRRLLHTLWQWKTKQGRVGSKFCTVRQSQSPLYTRMCMFACLVIGDSIGVGLSGAINNRYASGCDSVVEAGATIDQILAWRKPARLYGTTVLAVGSNDQPSRQLTLKLTRLRQNIATKRVIWMLPYSRERAYLINSIAVTFGDDTLDIARFRTSDRVHPISYDEIAAVLLPRGQPRGSRKSTVEWSQRSRR